MEIVFMIMGGVIVVLLVVVIVLLVRRGSSKESSALADFKAMEERLIRVEGEVGKINPSIDRNFRENRKEISENLVRMQNSNEKSLELLRTGNEKKLEQMRTSNEKSLEEMRETVDEKLKASVEKRFNESFKSISNQLTQVYQGLGEVKNMTSEVGSLKKVMEGVKTRGIYGEVQLGAIIEDILNKSQYEENVATKKGSSDRVEFAIKMPGKDAESLVYLPIDSKFPVENYSRLISAYDNGGKTEIEKFSKALANDVKEQAKKISTKYLDPPMTTDFGIMFVPTESLYAEILRIPGLSDEVRQKYHVSITSPSTLPVALNGLLMGFKTVAIEKRSAEVWQTLGAVKTQFGKFSDLLEGVQKKLQESANKIESAKTTSRSIERKLKNVEELPETESVKLIGEI
ncbi:DNA recombination protein RmuC [Candidatus Saccharibacteria bacterium]|nr:DNA recombination protein RmuC [Candidatus Saccharibacteria bacterium]MBR0372456.1 DNA recombination protein RmuC [Candidatus Saccharibacteria bacterium]